MEWPESERLSPTPLPWTLLHRDKPDHVALKPAAECPPVHTPKPDGIISFDKLSSVFIGNTEYEVQTPAHLALKDASVPVASTWRSTLKCAGM